MDNDELAKHIGELQGTVKEIRDDQKVMGEEIKEIRGWMNRWKGASATLLAVGAALGSIATWITDHFKWVR